MIEKSVTPSERGQALVLIVFGIIALIGLTALTVDGGNAYLDRRQAQNAADTAALGGALARIRGEAWVEKALDAAAQNGYDNNGVSNTVEVHSPPIDGPYTGNIEYIQVIVTSHVQTYFGSVLGWDQVTNRVEAVARTKTPEYEEIAFGNAVVSLAPTSDCENNKAFYAHGEGTLDITGNGVFVNSNNPTCAFIQQGNGSVRIDGGDLSIVGGASIQKPQLITPYPPQTGAIPISYPPPYIPPKIGCSKPAEIKEDGHTMSAGWWDDVFPPAGVNNLESGVYCLNDDFIVNSNDTLVGNNVVFLVEHGRVRFAGGATIQLDAPNSGDLKGLLIYLPMDNNSRVTLNGNADSTFTGTILAPASEIQINGNDSAYGFHSQIIGYKVDLSGDSNVVVVYDDEQNYDALTMPQIELTE